MRFSLKFRFSWIPFAVTLVVIAIGVSLGQWQTRRAADKQAIEEKLMARASAPAIVLGAAPADVDAIEYGRVTVHGEFVRGWPVYLDNRPYQGAPGFYVLMPLKITGSDQHVMVARGWIALNRADRTKLPQLVTPAGEVTITGIARRKPGHVLQLGRAPEIRPAVILQNLTIAEFAQASKLPMQPLLIEQLEDAQDGLVRDWPRPSSGVDMHRGYAFQWYGLALMAFIYFVVTGFRRGTKQAND